MFKNIILSLISSFIIFSSINVLACNVTDFGFYNGDPDVRLLENVIVENKNCDRCIIMLLTDVIYTDLNKKIWISPKGSIVDGASIPKFAWSIVGGPLDGQYRNASIIHDIGCVEKKDSWEDVHKVFYNGMKASCVDELIAKIMYGAVYFFGPRWETVKISIPGNHSNYAFLNSNNINNINNLLKINSPLIKKYGVNNVVFKTSKIENKYNLFFGQTTEYSFFITTKKNDNDPNDKAKFEKLKTKIKNESLSINEIEKVDIENL